MYRLVIAEKSSVAQSIAKVLGAGIRREGFLEGDGLLVSWCVGHLAGLAEPSVYNPAYARWRKKDLPIIPENWRFTIARDKRKQFDVLRTLLRREDISEVVNACDAGREGELIFRTVYHLAGCSKPVKRLWISSMEDSAIRDGFANLRPGSDYDGLHQAALCRLKADWLVGINATRLFSLLYGRTLNVGRVMSPTLAMIARRETEIAGFEPKAFYVVELSCGNMVLAGERLPDKQYAENIAVSCQGKFITIQTVERQEKTENAPVLYDLTSLQRVANRTLGYTAQQTLDYLQSLYEKKLCTYPRTDSRYLTDDMESTVPELVDIASVICGLDAPEAVLSVQVCNDKKVTDHHAIIPTKSAADADIFALPLGEREILRLAALGLLRAVCPPYCYTETSMTAECGGQLFTVKGRSVLDQGWKIYAVKEKLEDIVLPDGLSEGQMLMVNDVHVKTGKTTPPKHYTEDTILAAMENAGAQDMPENAERRGIGTPATRAGILEKLVASGFVERKKARKITSLISTQAGTSLAAVLPEILQSPLLTADWEHRLSEVERGELSPEKFMAGIRDLVQNLVNSYQLVPNAKELFPSGRETVGPCPRCGNDVTEHEKGFFCENRDCSFALWKDSWFFVAKKKTLTREIAAALLHGKQVKLDGCVSEKTGKIYNAFVTLEDNGERTDYRLEFEGKARK